MTPHVSVQLKTVTMDCRGLAHLSHFCEPC
jgi:hypothetical protein